MTNLMEDPKYCGGILADDMGLGKTSMTPLLSISSSLISSLLSLLSSYFLIKLIFSSINWRNYELPIYHQRIMETNTDCMPRSNCCSTVARRVQKNNKKRGALFDYQIKSMFLQIFLINNYLI